MNNDAGYFQSFYFFSDKQITMETIIENPIIPKVTEVDLVYRSKVKASQRPKIGSAADAYHIFKNNWDKDKWELLEQCKVLLLNRSNKVLGMYELSTGGICGTVVDIRLLLMAALKCCACGLVLCHNHPSGQLRASAEDKKITDKLKSACLLLEMNLLDHLIITPEGYFSFANEGYL